MWRKASLGLTVTPRTYVRIMEFWAQRTVSPVDGREGWTVVDERYVEHDRAGAWLRVLVDAQGRSVGTARTYAGRAGAVSDVGGASRG